MKLTVQASGPLAPYLIDLASAFQERGIPLTLVGGFGLVLRRQWRQEQGEQTLIEAVPPARATQDFDVLLSLEVLADDEKRLLIRTALSAIGFEVEKGKEYLHFFKPKSGGEGKRDVKIDFLAPPAPPADRKLKVKAFRVGSKNASDKSKLHGYKTPEAELLLGELLTLQLEGQGTGGDARTVQVNLPHPFSLVLMKLRAFRDEFEDRKGKGEDSREFARKHVADVYTLIALLTQPESLELITFAKTNAQHFVVQDAKNIVLKLLNTPNADGCILLRETLSISSEDLTTFLELLKDTFD